MHKYYLFIALMLFSTGTFAQVQRTPAPRKADSSTHAYTKGADSLNKKQIFREFNLSKEQKMKIKEIRESGKATRETIQNDSTLTAEQKKEKIRSLKKAQLQKIMEILTPEQRKRYLELFPKQPE